MNIEAPKTLTIDGVEYAVADFSEVVQRLVVIHTAWRNDLSTERLAVAKTEAAIRGLDAELAQAVSKELTEKAAVEKAPVEEVSTSEE